jgi:hypothetical protein
VIAVRILAVLAAVLLVGAFAIATILSYDMPLSELITMVDSSVVTAIHDLVSAHLPGWVWTNMLVPLLLRPAWLLPAGVGVICAGAAATVASSGSTQRSRRKRS